MMAEAAPITPKKGEYIGFSAVPLILSVFQGLFGSTEGGEGEREVQSLPR